MLMKTTTVNPAIAGFVAALVIPAYTLAQAINPDTIPEQHRNYSPYVEQTVNNANLAEGVYRGGTYRHTNC
jgi:hypothetical protein